MCFQIIDKPGVKLQGSVSSVNTVVPVGVDCHIELLVGLHEAFCQLVRILYVYVVVGRSVA